jgi:mannose-1-phosphate guanylyltransferase/mannose-6-phosphate isomerase
MKINTLILAGGKGTRLWPLSREDYPKQFYSIFNKSLFQKTVERALIFSEVEDIYVVTNKKYKFRIFDEMDEMGIQLPEENILLEPLAKNTLPAIYYGLKVIGNKNSKSVLVLPSDHFLEVNEDYMNAMREACRISDDYLVTFGIKPTKPHTGYGYIKPGRKIGERSYAVDEFVEKPDVDSARKYLGEGYLWNSGMFMLKPEVFEEECKAHQPDIFNAFKESDIERVYAQIPELSVDFGIMEKTNRSAVVSLDTLWSDVGSFDSLYEIFEKDESGNALKGECITINSRNNLVFGGRLIALVGIEDSVVIDTKDAILVCKRDESQKVKNIVEILRRQGDKRAEIHRTAHRPWGSYTILEENQFYKIKRLTVKPKKRLSLQKHYHRSEHWVVVRGTARIVVDGEERILRNGESTYIPAGTIHRLENPGLIPLEVIEVQIGEYLDEDDIERFDDDFGRKVDE